MTKFTSPSGVPVQQPQPEARPALLIPGGAGNPSGAA